MFKAFGHEVRAVELRRQGVRVVMSGVRVLGPGR